MSDGPRARLMADECIHKRGTACELLRRGDYCGTFPPPICPKLRDVPLVVPQPRITCRDRINILGILITEQDAEQLATALLVAARKGRND